MSEISAFLAAQLTPIVANVGALAIIAWIISICSNQTLAKTDGSPQLSPWVVGVGFGVTASLLMFVPVELAPGAFAGGRWWSILLSGIIGGPIAALITAVIAGVCRFLIGGPGYLTGPTYIVIFAVIGLAYWYTERKREHPRLGILRLFVLATAATIISIPSILFFPAELRMPVLTKLWPVLWISNIIGTIILGTLLDRERELFRRER